MGQSTLRRESTFVSTAQRICNERKVVVLNKSKSACLRAQCCGCAWEMDLGISSCCCAGSFDPIFAGVKETCMGWEFWGMADVPVKHDR